MVSIMSIAQDIRTYYQGYHNTDVSVGERVHPAICFKVSGNSETIS